MVITQLHNLDLIACNRSPRYSNNKTLWQHRMTQAKEACWKSFVNVVQYGGNDVTEIYKQIKRRYLTAAYCAKCACRLYVYHFIFVPVAGLFLVISTNNILVPIALSPSLSRRVLDTRIEGSSRTKVPPAKRWEKGYGDENAPRIATSGPVQNRKSPIHGLPVTLRILRVKSENLIHLAENTNDYSVHAQKIRPSQRPLFLHVKHEHAFEFRFRDGSIFERGG